jgi:two-component system phosphate regulon sensor histidine kinase PhoR
MLQGFDNPRNRRHDAAVSEKKKDKAVYNVAAGALLKAVGLLTVPALLVLTLYVVFGILSLSHMLYAWIIIVLATAIFVYPFLANLSALTNYVDELARDKRVQAPKLRYLNAPFDLSLALEHLQRSWEIKKQQMESIITEREILVDTLPDILIMVNDSRQIVRTNRAARAIFGQNLAKKPLRDVIQNDSLMDAVTSVIQDLKGREVEFRIQEPVLRDFLAIIERFPVPSAGGISTIITMNDITELKSVEQMRADFVANASHEIRTPLASIKGFIETLIGPAKDDAQAREEFLQIMLDQADRMQQLINDLLSLSKIEMNANAVPVDPVDLVKVIRKVQADLTMNADSKQMQVIADIHDNLPLVKGDSNELRQVIYNLVSNAIKYGYSGSEVRVKAKITSELPSDIKMRNLQRVVMVSVSDQGEGIPRQHLPRLMERFYRVDSARTREIGGTGLGLAIVKGIVVRHRGAITVDSIEGEGSTFTVYLPIFEE